MLLINGLQTLVDKVDASYGKNRRFAIFHIVDSHRFSAVILEIVKTLATLSPLSLRVNLEFFHAFVQKSFKANLNMKILALSLLEHMASVDLTFTQRYEEEVFELGRLSDPYVHGKVWLKNEIG
jgi:hypothetical protein